MVKNVRYKKRIEDEALFLIKKNGSASSSEIIHSAISRNPKWVKWMPKSATVSAWMKTYKKFKSVPRRAQGRTVLVWECK